MPVGRSGKLKSPDGGVFIERVRPVPVCSIFTVASGIAAPDVSATLPEILPRNVWQNAGRHNISNPLSKAGWVRMDLIEISSRYDNLSSPNASRLGWNYVDERVSRNNAVYNPPTCTSNLHQTC